jgi:hypothetical protein
MSGPGSHTVDYVPTNLSKGGGPMCATQSPQLSFVEATWFWMNGA